ncbi:MAG: gamma carbonic anhydrase family protein [bacterium]|nr:gamma carbonic anhydrase family protein [bacterium]MCP5039962.1 gamma carbonic anhydrase family protein [bacterium]
MQKIHETVFVADGARLFGKVEIGEGSSVWYNAVIRAECQEVRIGRYTNLQDFSLLHVGFDHPTVIGDFCSITHHTTIHGATIGDACLIGINATIMDGAVIGAGSIVGGGAFVTEGSEFPSNSIILGAPAKLVKERENTNANRLNAWVYHRNAQAYARGDHRAWDGEEYDRWRKAKIAEIERGEA